MFDTNKTIGKVKVRDLSASEIYSSYRRSIAKKTVRHIVERGGIGFETLRSNSNKELAEYARQLAKDKYSLNKKYTVNDLAQDWGKNRLSARQIRSVSSKMDDGKTHDQAVSETIALGNAAVDVILNRFDL